LPALFPRWANTIARVLTASVVAAPVTLALLLMAWVRTAYVTGINMQIEQPIRFDHRHHVRDDGIDCLYCHVHAERSDWAGYPSTDTCMGCHSQVWNESPLLAPVRNSMWQGEPLVWRRVHDLPDHVHFTHRGHVNRGVGCESCHGRVDLMAAVYPVRWLSMGWCLGCHRDPAPALRPLSEITTMGYEPSPGSGAVLARELDIAPPTHCTACHR
jgi:hypothetical protein